MPPQDDDEGTPPRGPATPRRVSGVGQRRIQIAAAIVASATPPNRRVSGAGLTPKSAPAAGGVRKTSNNANNGSPQINPLLADFLLGRPSPGRQATTQKRRKSLDVVKTEMRQASVQKLQQPGGVKDRVKQWQKTNAKAMSRGDPLATPSEPTDVAFDDADFVSVTEEDRIRIKFRKKRKSSTPRVVVHNADDDEYDTEQDLEEKGKQEDDKIRASPLSPNLGGPPKKRVVSDDHWMNHKKNARKSLSKEGVSPKGVAKEPSPTPIPKDFLQRTAQNPPVSRKIQDWAARVEVPEPQSTPKRRTPKAREIRDDGIRVNPVEPEEEREEEEREVRTLPKKKPSKRQVQRDDDGIRITPTRTRQVDDDGIRITPLKTRLPGDGIRVQPMEGDGPAVRSTPRKSSKKHVRPTPKVEERPVSPPSPEIIDAIEDPPVDMEVSDASEPEVQTPTKKRLSSSKFSRMGKQRTVVTERTEETNESKSWISEDDSSRQHTYEDGSERTSAAAKSLAAIPVGYSAFSELDLPVGADAHSSRRPKAQRNPSFKAMTMGLKKVVTEGKKIITDKVDPPKPVANQPPSIEKWLKNTVDPFVDGPSGEATPVPKQAALEKEWKAENLARRKSSVDVGETVVSSLPSPAAQEDEENVEPKPTAEKEPAPAKETQPKTPTSAGLKRSKATRTASSPLVKSAGKSAGKPAGNKTVRKVSAGKKPLREVLKEAFKGESSGHVHPLNNYISTEDRSYDTYDGYDDRDNDDAEWETSDSRRRSSGSSKSTDPSDLSAPTVPPQSAQDAMPSMSGPRRKPPTNGLHELSTIVSVESYSTHESDVASTLSHSTVTQTTAFTKDSRLSRQPSSKSGLKRRLTKHSDLVSVLSLPDDRKVGEGLRSVRSRPSLRRARSKPDGASLQGLMKEFAEDESLYQRELKTLVDGVIPVLLTEVIHGDTRSSVNLFGPDSPSRKADNMSKAVVSMGVALEKLKTAHRRAPLHDAHRLASWIQATAPIYDSYLDAWRLGFQDLIVTLAPPADRPDDDDSLLNAMPRNEHGDVINADGERVDVAHLLKRPIIRLKLLAKFAKGMDAVSPSDETKALVECLEALQEKARRRLKEESARLTDEDAINTDTRRARDLRTLAPMDSVKIEPGRGVSAKDVFSLNLPHSSGQRLECQVELVHRDNPAVPNDRGDVLIREVGDGRRSWLLFPPVPMVSISSRRGEGKFEMVVMIRGSHNKKNWHELLILSTDTDEQILDWLDILGTNPLPPSQPAPSVISEPIESQSPRTAAADVPVGAAKLRKERPASPGKSPVPSPAPAETPTKRPTPSRYHARGASLPAMPLAPSPVSSGSPSPQKTPTQDMYMSGGNGMESPPDKSQKENVRPEPAKLKKPSPNSTPYRADGAPPPPIHRTLGPPKSPTLQVPDLHSPRVKRRTSSPLKHEYLPSDVSSESGSGSGSVVSDESDSESSSDEIDSADIPDTEIGISIKKEPVIIATESAVSDSTCSLTPSNSASQAGLYGHKRSGSEPQVVRYFASISYWSDRKGQWKDISTDPCSIIIGPGTIEAYALNISSPGKRSSTDAENGHGESGSPQPLLALDLTPLVLLRQSTVVDLEIRSAVRENCKHRDLGGGNFRFRCPTQAECFNLYMAVHHARLNNERYIQLENETRFRHFGERRPPAEGENDNNSSSSRRRSWLGRKNSYRASTRAPSQSQEGSTTPSSSLSASSFLKRLTGSGNSSFNIAGSSVDKQSHSGRGASSLYTSGSSSAGGTPPRSPSVSIDGGSSGHSRGSPGGALGTENIRIRLHTLVTATKWEDLGNCVLQIRRPPPGWHMDLRANHGLEKRITVTSCPKKEGEKPRQLLDAVLGSGCFSPMGSRGIVCGVWEEVRDEKGEIGAVPARGGAGGSVKKWCFQCGSVAEANWVLRLVHQEVVRA